MSVLGLLLFVIIVGLSSVINRAKRREAEEALNVERKRVHEAIKTLHAKS